MKKVMYIYPVFKNIVDFGVKPMNIKPVMPCHIIDMDKAYNHINFINKKLNTLCSYIQSTAKLSRLVTNKGLVYI